MVKYEQSTGRLFGPDGNFWVSGYSGAGEGKNNSTLQRVPNVGPIPQGTYTIGEPHYSPHTGPFTMDLEPTAGTDTFGRGDFRIHGDAVDPDKRGKSSHGCIILPRRWRERIHAENVDRLLLVE